MTKNEFKLFWMNHQDGLLTIAQQVLCDIQRSEYVVIEAMTRMYRSHIEISFASETEAQVYARLMVQTVADEWRQRSPAVLPLQFYPPRRGSPPRRPHCS